MPRKVQLTTLPTPLQKLGFFTKNEIFIKRDDMTDFLLGGNKARKVEFFMEEAIKNKNDFIVTYGGAQSNHCRIVAGAANKLGLPCLLILAKPENNLTKNGNYFIYNLLRTEIIWSEVSKVAETIQRELSKLTAKGYKPYFIPGGGHGNLGTHAYLEAYKEIENQKKELKLSFDYIFLASGTGTTQAGLIVGNKLFNNHSEKIIGISVARKKETAKKIIAESVNNYFTDLKTEQRIGVEEINFLEDYIGTGYGDVYPEILKTIKHIARHEGILLDPIYTGKAFWGMTDYIQKNNITDKRILFIHTGGIPLLFNYYFKFHNPGKSGD